MKIVFPQGWYALIPLEDETTNKNLLGWTAFVGGTLFEVGGYGMVVEAINRGNDIRFGYEVCCTTIHSSRLTLQGG